MNMISILLITSKNKYLLIKRSPTDHSYAAHWGMPGGSVEQNETPLDGVIREAKEELGLTITDIQFLKRYKHNKTEINLFVHNSPDFNPHDIVLNEEHTEWGMYSYFEITGMKDVIPSNITFIGDYVKRLRS